MSKAISITLNYLLELEMHVMSQPLLRKLAEVTKTKISTHTTFLFEYPFSDERIAESLWNETLDDAEIEWVSN